MNPSTSRTDPQSQFLNFLPSHSQSISGSPSGGSSPAAEFNATSAATTKSPFGVPSPLSSGGTSLSHTAGSMSTVNRLGTGAGSPSHDLGGGTRLYSKRGREGVPSIWGSSTPLHESIPESPREEFPDLIPPAPVDLGVQATSALPGRRTRAGTVPSRFPSVGLLNSSNLATASQSAAPGGGGPGSAASSSPWGAATTTLHKRPTPTGSPFRPDLNSLNSAGAGAGATASSRSPGATGLLSRLRAGSLPQSHSSHHGRASPHSFLAGVGMGTGTSGPFGSSLFTTAWGGGGGRERASTLASIRSGSVENGPTATGTAGINGNGQHSPSTASFLSRDGLADTDIKTLDYLGLAETPTTQQLHQHHQLTAGEKLLLRRHQQQQAQQQQAQQQAAQQASIAPLLDLASLNRGAPNRYRSYSVNAKEKYAEEDDARDMDMDYVNNPYLGANLHGSSNSAAEAAVAAQLAETQAQIHQHNLAVQAFANQTSAAAAAVSAAAGGGNGGVTAPVGGSRPRARTAGVLENPLSRSSSLRNYLVTPSRLDNHLNIADFRIAESTSEEEQLAQELSGLSLGLGGNVNVNNLAVAAAAAQAQAQAQAQAHAQAQAQSQQNANRQRHDGTPGANSNMDEHALEGPTRALWIGSIPVSTTITSLDAIFKTFGAIESTRVLTHKNCGFVNFENLESAVTAKRALNGREIFPGAGPVRIGFAKVPTSGTGTPGAGAGSGAGSGGAGLRPSSTPDPQNAGNDSSAGAAGSRGGDEKGSGVGRDSSAVNGGAGTEKPEVPPLPELLPEMQRIVVEFGASEEDVQTITGWIQSAIEYQDFEKEIPPIPEPSQTRIHDAPKLRDFRKRIDNGACSPAEIEEIAIGMLPEITELSSDYLGNTVVQKLFEFCSEEIKEKMLAEIAPHLADIGVHKNGTWAAQKIIDVAKTDAQKRMIVENLRPHTVSLFLDQYGNYVLQCCLRFGPPYTDFIFETMLSRMWEIAQGRFGARAMRACLESHHATKDQQRMLAAAIALHSVKLATNSNGALLLTWFLDTCTFPHRRTVLAPRLVPHLVHLCTHKVAYLTVLKVINQRNEPEARETVLKALFYSPNDETLERILSDQSSGATLIFKVLTTPCFDSEMREEVVKTVAKVLTDLKTTPSQGYKRLMDEVGLSSRGHGSDSHHGHHSREHSHGEKHGRGGRHGNNHNNSNAFNQQAQYGNQYMRGIPQYDNPLLRPNPADGVPSTYDPYTFGALSGALPFVPPMATPSAYPQDAMMTGLTTQQLQYQAFLAAQQQQQPQPPTQAPPRPQPAPPAVAPAGAPAPPYMPAGYNYAQYSQPPQPAPVMPTMPAAAAPVTLAGAPPPPVPGALDAFRAMNAPGLSMAPAPGSPMLQSAYMAQPPPPPVVPQAQPQAQFNPAAVGGGMQMYPYAQQYYRGQEHQQQHHGGAGRRGRR